MDGPRDDRPDGRRPTRVPARGDGTTLPARRQRHDPTAPIRRKQPRPLPDFTGMQPVAENLAQAGYNEFLPAAQQIVVTPPSPRRRAVAYIVCGSVVIAFIWSIFGHLSLFAIAPGQLQTRGGSQVVETRETGQISKIPVQNGTHVTKGDIVLQLDPTAAQAAKTIIESKLANARAESVRRGAAVFVARAATIDKQAPISWPKDIPADVKTREESVFRADIAQLAATLADLKAKLAAEEAMRTKYVGNISAQKVLIDSRTQRLAMHEKLAEKGWDSRATVLQAQEPLREDQVRLATYEGSLDESKATIKVIEDELAHARAKFIAENTTAGATATAMSKISFSS